MPEPSQVKVLCQKHGDVPYLIVEAGEYKKTYCLVCFDEVMTRLGVHCVRPVVVEHGPIEWSKDEPVEWPKELLEVE